MLMTPTRRLFRHFALVIATVHLVVFAVAPVLEASITVGQSGIGVVATGDTPDRSIPTHDPSTCIACQIISSVTAVPQPATIFLPTDDASTPDRFPVHGTRQVFAAQGFLSRAPPTLPA
jgi:hypothetical protein